MTFGVHRSVKLVGGGEREADEVDTSWINTGLAAYFRGSGNIAPVEGNPFAVKLLDKKVKEATAAYMKSLTGSDKWMVTLNEDVFQFVPTRQRSIDTARQFMGEFLVADHTVILAPHDALNPFTVKDCTVLTYGTGGKPFGHAREVLDWLGSLMAQ